MRKSILAMFLFLVSLRAFAADINISVMGGRVMVQPAGTPSAVYFTLYNNTSKEIALTGASGAGCGSIAVQQGMNAGGNDEMKDATSVSVPAGGSVEFKPGGYHLTCINSTLQPGIIIPLTLDFAGGTKYEAYFMTKDARGSQ